MLQPIGRHSLADAVFTQLRAEILAGRLAPGADLPAERQLCETLGVSRPALREAIARLAQARLLTVRHGGKTRVSDWRKSAGLDLLPHLFDSLTDPEVLRSALEMRAALGPEVARRCAERSPEVGPTLLRLVEDMAGEQDLLTLRRLNVELWQVLCDGSRNLAYQLAYNSLRRAVDPHEEAVAAVLGVEMRDLEGFRAIAEAVAAGDADAAERATRRHLSVDGSPPADEERGKSQQPDQEPTENEEAPS